MRDAQSFGQQIARGRAAGKIVRGTIFEAGNATAGVELPDGVRLRRVPTAGVINVGDVVDVEIAGSGARILTAGEAGAGGVSVLSGGTGGGWSTGAPSPHDLLGAHHTLPTLSANLFLASPSSTAGLPSFRAIVPADLPGQFAGFANPTAQIGLTAINGVATTAMRSDAAPAINVSITPTWTGLHTFGAGAKIDAGQSLYFGADVALSRIGAGVLGLGAGDSYQSTGFVSGITGWNITGNGDAEFNNIVARGELRAFVFKINELSATAGTFGVFYSAATANADFTTAASVGGSFTLQAKNSDAGGMLFGVGDICRVKAWNGSGLVDAWFTITARTNNTTYTSYTATLNSGSTSTVIREGSAIVDYGPSGTGFITLSADGTVGSSPNITLATHAGAPWTTITPQMRIGNLNGYGSYATNVYGIAIGNPTGAWMTAEGGVVKMRQGANDVIVLDGGANSSYFAGVVTIGTSGEIRQGTGTLGSNFTGLRLWNSSGVGLIAGYNANVVQWQAGTDGKFYVGPYIRGDQDGLYVYGNYQPGYGTSGSLQVRTAGSVYFGYDNYRSPRMFGTVTSNGTPTSGGTDYSSRLDVILPASGVGGSAKTWSIDSGTGSMSWDGSISAASAVYASNWYRSYGDTGWYSETYGGGIYMVDTTWVRTYNGKSFYSAGRIQAAGGISSCYTMTGQIVASATSYGAFLVPAERDVTVSQWTMNVYIQTTNNGSNYWQFDLKRLSDGALIDSWNTSGWAANTWGRSARALSSAITASSHLGVYVDIIKIGSPGAVQCVSMLYMQ